MCPDLRASSADAPHIAVARQLHLIPGHQDSGPDYASCKLPRAVTDVAIVPILMGCGVQVLDTESPVVWCCRAGQNGVGTLDR